MNELHLFAGAGGGLLASKLLGWNTVCAVEIEQYPREVLLQRQRDGMLERFPIWDDVRTFDGKPWRGKIDVISGGFPCQDISSAGKGAGITGSRSGLWKEYARIIGEVRPSFVFAENSPLLRSRGLGTVLHDLNELGYNARWGVLGAGHFGAVHKRARMWILAYDTEDTSIKKMQAKNRTLCSKWSKWESGGATGCVGWQGWGVCESRLDRVIDGVADRVDRTRAIGNGQVPAVAALAFSILSEGIV